MNRFASVLIGLAVVSLAGCGSATTRTSSAVTAPATRASTASTSTSATKAVSASAAASTTTPASVPESTKASPVPSTASASDSIITRENNSEFDRICVLKDDFDPSIAEFAKKYAGRTVVFDGALTNVMRHGTAKTRFDILLQAGDYIPDKAAGPNFKFNDVGVFDLHLSGTKIPDSLGVGQNYRFTAKIDSFDGKSGLFYLKPIRTEMR